ncbi:MAG: TonB-dependent receptor [Proteobacteria bacterium]|nr:TonB-dependent receptor [Pseudomonadota bacterium]
MKNGTCDRWRPIHSCAAAAGAAAFFLAGTGTARADYLEVCRDAQARGEVLDQSCTEALRREEDRQSFGLSLGTSQYTLGPRAFLARENLGTNVLELGIARPGSHVRTNTYGLEYSSDGFSPFGLSSSSSLPFGGEVWRIFGSLMWSEGSANTFFPTIDPGAGHGLGIPGINGGASGIFLPVNPQNTVVDAEHRVEIRWGQVDLNLGFATDDNLYTPDFHVGLRYSDLDQRERFGGDIPGYGAGSGFQYQFHTETRAVGIHAGFSGAVPLRSNDSWDVALRYAGEFGVARIAGDGFAQLENYGTLAVVPPSSNTFDISGYGAYASLQASLEARFNERFSAQLGVRYDLRPWGAGFSGDGTNPFTMQFQDMQVVTAFLGARVRF